MHRAAALAWGIFVFAGVALPADVGGVTGDTPPAARRPLDSITFEPTIATTSAPVATIPPEIVEVCLQARALAADAQAPIARTLLLEALDHSSGNLPEVRLELADVALQLDDFQLAQSMCDAALAQRPQWPRALLVRGEVARARGDWALASRHYRLATQLSDTAADDPFVTAAWYRLGETLEREGYTLAAAESLDRFVERCWGENPEHRFAPVVAKVLESEEVVVYRRAVGLFERIGDVDAAIRSAQRAADLRPSDGAAAQLLLDVLGRAGRCDDVLKRSLAWFESGAASGGAPILPPRAFAATLVSAARDCDRIDDLIAALTKRSVRGGLPNLNAIVAEELRSQAQPEAARRLLLVGAESQPDSRAAAAARIRADLAAGERSSAAETLAAFLRRTPGELDILAEAFLPLDSTPRSVESPAVTTSSSPADLEATVAEVLTRLATGAGAAELDRLEALHASGENPLLLRISIALANLMVDRWERARDLATQVIEMSPRCAVAACVRGLALIALDDPNAAKLGLHEAARLKDDVPHYAFELGRFFNTRTDDRLGAQRWLNSALRIDPTFSPALDELVTAYVADRPPKAEQAKLAIDRAERMGAAADSLRRSRLELRFAGERWSSDHVDALARDFAAFPNDSLTGRRLVEGRLRNADAENALLVVTALMQRDPRNYELAQLASVTYAQVLDFGQAVAAQRLITERFPMQFQGRLRLCELLRFDFDIEAARRELRELIRIAPDNNRRNLARELLYSAYADFGETDEALKLIDEWSALPEGGAWKSLRFSALANGRRWDQLLRELNSALAKHPDDLNLRSIYLGFAPRCGATDEAIERLKKWAEAARGPARLNHQLGLVRMLRQAKRTEEALGICNKILNESADALPGSARIEVLIARANCLSDLGRIDEALDAASEASTRAVEAEADLRPLVREETLAMLLRAEQYDRALQLLDRWPPDAEFGGEATLLRQRCGVLQAARRDVEYTAVAERLLELVPNNPGINNDLGYTWVDRGENVDRAERMIRRAVAFEPTSAAYLDSLGWARYKRGDFAGARFWLERATRLVEGRDPVLFDHRGDAEYRAGDHDAAQASWAAALEIANEALEVTVSNRDPKFSDRVTEKLRIARDAGTPQLAPLAENMP